MTKHKTGLYVLHILESIEYVEKFAPDQDTLFGKERQAYFAVLRVLQTLAESTQRLPDEIKKKYPDIDWAKIAGFRNVLVHDYLGDFNQQLLWSIISERLPELKEAMERERPKGTSKDVPS